MKFRPKGLNREHRTGTERKSPTQECGWKGGDRGGLAQRKKNEESREREEKLLTGIGLLMEGVETPIFAKHANRGNNRASINK
jgi:hypothetical protein